jgi:hypothetical protein
MWNTQSSTCRDPDAAHVRALGDEIPFADGYGLCVVTAKNVPRIARIQRQHRRPLRFARVGPRVDLEHELFLRGEPRNCLFERGS